jgi:hypothetical protein
MLIPDPDFLPSWIHQQQKGGGGIFLLCYLFCGHNFDKILRQFTKSYPILFQKYGLRIRHPGSVIIFISDPGSGSRGKKSTESRIQNPQHCEYLRNFVLIWETSMLLGKIKEIKKNYQLTKNPGKCFQLLFDWIIYYITVGGFVKSR